MTPAGFAVFVTARSERDYRRLLKRHPELPGHYAAVLAALKHDPYNRTRRYQIKSWKKWRRATVSSASATGAFDSASISMESTCF
jgi:hypothetical protein